MAWMELSQIYTVAGRNCTTRGQQKIRVQQYMYNMISLEWCFLHLNLTGYVIQFKQSLIGSKTISICVWHLHNLIWPTSNTSERSLFIQINSVKMIYYSHKYTMQAHNPQVNFHNIILSYKYQVISDGNVLDNLQRNTNLSVTGQNKYLDI